MRRALLVAGVALVDVHVVAALACLLCRVLDGVVGMHAVTAAAVDGRMIFVLGQGVGVHYRAVGVGEDGAGFSLGGQVLLAAVATAAEAGGGIDGGLFQPFGRLVAELHAIVGGRQAVDVAMAGGALLRRMVRCGHRRVAERVALGAVSGGAVGICGEREVPCHCGVLVGFSL